MCAWWERANLLVRWMTSALSVGSSTMRHATALICSDEAPTPKACREPVRLLKRLSAAMA